MAQLKNSQRISYKATYVQINQNTNTTVAKERPTPVNGLQRALEKAAFIQSLRILPVEVTALSRGLLKSISDDAGKAAMTAAINAIEKLVNDPSASSTLNNAAAFAAVSSNNLVDFAKGITAHHKTIADTINSNTAAILASFKASVLKQPVSAGTADPGAGSPGGTAGGKTATGKNEAGIGIKTITFDPVTAPVAKGDPEQVESTNVKVIVAITGNAASVLDPSVGTHTPVAAVFKPTNNDAITWAEKNSPDLFNKLFESVLPYIGMDPAQTEIAGKSQSLLKFISGAFRDHFNEGLFLGLIQAFQSRMQIEPVGNLHLERVEMYPAGIERGELVHSVPLAPNETVNISHKEWSVSEKEFEEIVDDYFEGYSEEGVAEKNDMSMSNDSQTRHATALNLGASLSASYATVTLSTNFGYNSTSDDQQSKKDSRNHSMDITKKASSRTKKDHKVTFKVSSVAGSEDQSVRVITNPSDTDAMRIDYFQLARKWKVDLLRYGLRMTYDIVIPDPGSGLIIKVKQAKGLQDIINSPFSFTLPLSAVNTGNYNTLGATYGANVTAPPEAEKWVNVHKEIPRGDDDFYGHTNFDSIEFEIDENYYIDYVVSSWNFVHNHGDTVSYFQALTSGLGAALSNLAGKSGKLSLDFMFKDVRSYAINLTFHCVPKVGVIQDWRLQAWNQLMQGAQDAYNKNLESLKDQLAELTAEINGYDALTLRKMEQEEIMKGVLRWLFGPNFYLVPFDISGLFGYDSNDPGVTGVLDPNQLSPAEWMSVMEHGEFIKYIHNAIEWENVLYFTYPYFWDDNSLWDFKKFLYHPDPTHRSFLRAGAARVVLTIRPGFEPSFTQLVETGAFGSLPGDHPYVTIAQEIQDFANTNYPGFPPANPEQNARPLLYLEQRRVWKEMQYLVQLLNAFKANPANNGFFPSTAQGLTSLTPYLAAINTANQNANSQQLALDSLTPLEALLPANYTAVPVNDFWGKPYFYQCPGITGDYDLISYGADGVPGGEDKNADISANAEASLIATWFEYTPTNALDIAVTMNKAGVIPPPIDSSLA